MEKKIMILAEFANDIRGKYRVHAPEFRKSVYTNDSAVYDGLREGYVNSTDYDFPEPDEDRYEEFTRAYELALESLIDANGSDDDYRYSPDDDFRVKKLGGNLYQVEAWVPCEGYARKETTIDWRVWEWIDCDEKRRRDVARGLCEACLFDCYR